MANDPHAASTRYEVVLGCGHRGSGTNLSTYPPTIATVAKCEECGRHVPVVVEVRHA